MRYHFLLLQKTATTFSTWLFWHVVIKVMVIEPQIRQTLRLARLLSTW
jgi:hypothetical protein